MYLFRAVLDIIQMAKIIILKFWILKLYTLLKWHSSFKTPSQGLLFSQLISIEIVATFNILIKYNLFFHVTEGGRLIRGRKGVLGKFFYRIVCKNHIPFSLLHTKKIVYVSWRFLMELVFSMTLVSTAGGFTDEICLPNRTDSCTERDSVSLELRYCYCLMI